MSTVNVVYRVIATAMKFYTNNFIEYIYKVK